MIIGSQFKGDIVGKSWWPEWEAAGPHASTVGKQRDEHYFSAGFLSLLFISPGTKDHGKVLPIVRVDLLWKIL